MSIDLNKDYTRQEQLELDLSDLFSQGITDKTGQMRPEIQSIGVAATALQAEADGVPVEMVGRIVTTAHEISLNEAKAYPEDLVEELEKRNHPALAKLIRLGIAACRTDADYQLFKRWLVLLHNMMIIRSKQNN